MDLKSGPKEKHKTTLTLHMYCSVLTKKKKNYSRPCLLTNSLNKIFYEIIFQKGKWLLCHNTTLPSETQSLH